MGMWRHESIIRENLIQITKCFIFWIHWVISKMLFECWKMATLNLNIHIVITNTLYLSNTFSKMMEIIIQTPNLWQEQSLEDILMFYALSSRESHILVSTSPNAQDCVNIISVAVCMCTGHRVRDYLYQNIKTFTRFSLPKSSTFIHDPGTICCSFHLG